MHTTSKLLKEVPIEGKDLDKFKEKFWNSKVKSKHGESWTKDIMEYLNEEKAYWEKARTNRALEK